MYGMSSKVWQPHRGLLPIKKPHLNLPRIPHQLLVDELSSRGQSHPELLRGSPDHLAHLVEGLEALREQYCVAHPNGHSLTMEDAIEGILTECLALLDPPESIKDDNLRSHFFTVVRKVASQLMEVIEKQQELEKRKQGPIAKALRTLPNGYKDGRPRWSQFLGLDAPGARRLQLEERGFLQPQRRAYQILPQGGIGILRHWDNEGKAFVQSIDPLNNLGIWTRRFEWGALGQHRLAMGVRRFDPLNFTPSPWRKFMRFKEPVRKSLLNKGRAELEFLDRCAGETLVEVDPETGEMIADDDFGVSLRANVQTYDRVRWQQLADNHRSSDQWDGFDCVLVTRFIRDDELERAREADTWSEIALRKMGIKKKRQGVIAPTFPSSHAGSSSSSQPAGTSSSHQPAGASSSSQSSEVSSSSQLQQPSQQQ